MGLARAWRRPLYASLGWAVVVPAALMVSLALLAGGGGSFSLGSLKQAISGPAAPPTQPVTLGATNASAPVRAVVARVTPGGAKPVRATLLAATHVARHVTSSLRASTAPSDRVGQGVPGSTEHSGGSGSSGGGGGGSHHPAHQTMLDRIVKTVTPVTSKLPSPAGPTVTKMVNTVAKVGDGVLSHLP